MASIREAFDGPLPEGWSGGEPITKFWRGNFVHLYRVARTCKSCPAEISIDVTRNALEGKTRNTGLLLRNCPKCREERKNGGPGSRGGASRPIASVDAVTVGAVPPDELERLRMANSVMKQELEGLYARDQGLFAENQALKARLATYELQGAVVEASKNKMPWEKIALDGV